METKLVAEIVCGESPEDCHVLMGGDPLNPTWEDYLAGFKEEWQPRIQAIKETIIQENKFVSAAYFCNDNYFKLSDGTSIAFTWRAWGDLLQAIENKQEGYLKWYM